MSTIPSGRSAPSRRSAPPSPCSPPSSPASASTACSPYTLTQRRREIGIRIALGARPADIGRATLLRVLAILAAGAALGIAAAIPAARLMQTVLFEIAPTDFTSHAAAVALMLLAGLAAAGLPAWRASRIDPWQSLRAD